MASEYITAILRVRDQARFVRDMRAAARSIDKLTMAGMKQERQDRLNATASDLFSRSSKRSGISQAQLKDHLSLTRGELMTTALTIGSYTAPALLALGASASAAVLGGAAVGGGGLTALLIGLSGFGIIGAKAVSSLQKVRQAQQAYNIAVDQYGATSKQASQASAHMFAVVNQNGGIPVLRAANAMKKLGDSWKSLTKEARSNVFGVFSDALTSAQKILPTFAKETNANSAVIRRDLKHIFDVLSGTEGQKNLTVFSDIFRQISGPLSRAFLNVMLTIMNIFRAAGPYIIQAAQGFENITMSWRNGTSDGTKLGSVMAMLIGHTKSWWNLLKAVGRVFFELFMGSHQAGKSLVDDLTHVVNKFADWLHGMRQTGQLQDFFRKFGVALREVLGIIVPMVTILGQLIIASLPAFAKAGSTVTDMLKFMNGNIGIFAAMIRLISPLIPALVTTFVAWKLATITLAVPLALVSTALKAIWTAWKIGQAVRIAIIAWTAVFRTGLLMLMGQEVATGAAGAGMWAAIFGPVTLVVAAVALVVAAVVLLYMKWKWFHDAVNNTWNWIKTNWPLLPMIMMGPIGMTIAAFISLFGTIKKLASDAFQFISNGFSSVLNWIRMNWSLLPGIMLSPIGLTIAAFTSFFGQLKQLASDAVHFIADRFRDLLGFFGRIPGDIWDKVKGVFGTVAGATVGQVPGAAGAVAGAIGGGGLPFSGGKAAGGVIPYGTYGLVGERGPELASPGLRGTMISPIARGRGSAPAPITWPEISGVIHVHVDTSVKMDRRELLRAHGDAVADRKARRGQND